MSRRLLSVELGKVHARSLSESLLALTLITGAYYLLGFVPKHIKAGQPVVALANYFLVYAPIQDVNRPAYVIPDSIGVWDTPAEIRVQIATLHSGEELQALGHFRAWTHVRMPNGKEGWTNTDGLMSARTHETEERLDEEISDMPAQARGHTLDAGNLHIEPLRQSAIVAQANQHQSLEIFNRRMVRREDGNRPVEMLSLSRDPLEAWYLVRDGSHTGWILGKLVQLDIPKGISAYAQATNLVAWLVLDTVNDQGDPMPQYIVADRVGTKACDFTDIRVLTWWKKKQTYAIAYKEGGLLGYFPILVTHEGSIPYFRLRLVNGQGVKSQKFYGLFDTITRVIGTANGWQSDAVADSRAFTRGTGG
jgi:hypothetical protein